MQNAHTSLAIPPLLWGRHAFLQRTGLGMVGGALGLAPLLREMGLLAAEGFISPLSSSAPLHKLNFHRYEDYVPLRFTGPASK